MRLVEFLHGVNAWGSPGDGEEGREVGGVPGTEDDGVQQQEGHQDPGALMARKTRETLLDVQP